MPKLIINPGTPQAREYELKPGNNYVGRAFSNDLKLEDGSVSGSHAVVVVDGHTVTIKDLGSTNGTRVNQLPATGNPLQSGQMLKLGAVELLFMADAPGVPASVTAPAPALTPVASQISTDFIIREPGRVGVAPVAPAPVPVSHSAEVSMPRTASAVMTPPPPAQAVAAPPPAPVPIVAPNSGSRISNVAEAPAPIKVWAAPLPAALAMPSAAPVPAPAPEPRATPPTTPGAMEAPVGMTMCKFHRKNPGQWLCPKCQLLFCSLCVATQPTPQGPKQFCRSCGTSCVLVKVKFETKKEKSLKSYSDMAILMRSIGFGAGGAILGGGLWIGFTVLTQFDIPAIFAPIMGLICGFAVQRACQDRPGVVFSLIAVFATLLGVAIGKIGAIMLMHGFIFDVKTLAMGVFGLVLGLFLAWKFGGGDF